MQFRGVGLWRVGFVLPFPRALLATLVRFPSRPLSACVACHSLVTSTGQLCDIRGARTTRPILLRGYSEKQEPSCPPTFRSRISTSFLERVLTIAALRSWLMARRSFTLPKSPVTADGGPKRHRAARDGAAFDQARRRKEPRCPELTGEQGRVRMVVLGCETGERWSDEAHKFLRHLARARVRSKPQKIRAVA